MESIYPYLAGRSLLEGEVKDLLANEKIHLSPKKLQQACQQLVQAGLAEQLPAVHHSFWSIRRYCQRCTAGPSYIEVSNCARCGSITCAYCTRCLMLGRAKSCTSLFRFLPIAGQSMDREENHFPLLPANQNTVVKLEEGLASDELMMTLLMVPGAGKIMTLCPVLQKLILAGKRIFWCREHQQTEGLVRRLSLFFPEATHVGWENSLLTIGTTQDLIRYHQCFHLVILDGVELDSLALINRTLSPKGKILHLTPFFPKQHVSSIIVHPVRRNRRPLVTPTLLIRRKLWRLIEQNKPIDELIRFFDMVKASAGQALLVVPHTEAAERTMDWLNQVMPDVANLTGQLTFEDDTPLSLFADKKYLFLLAPFQFVTPLRAKKLHLCVLGADHLLYHRSDLVNLSYHVGKNLDGEIWFIGEERTDMMVQTKKELKYLNDLAEKEGYLQEEA